MKKLASMFLSMLLFVSALSMRVSASSNVSSTDFKVENGEMVDQTLFKTGAFHSL